MTLTAQSVWNVFDELGLLLGQPRLPLERNRAYKQRLLGVFAQKANSTYTGLINGINRELGLQTFPAITITPKSIGGVFTGINPVFQISEALVRLYGDITVPTSPDLIIDRFELTGTDYTLTALVADINAHSTYFTAALLAGVDGTTRAMTLLNQTNQIQVVSELVPCSSSFSLVNNSIVQGTVFFSDRNIFKTQVAVGSVTSAGQYSVNNTTGVVTVFNVPTPNTTVRYTYIKSPFTCISSSVIIHNLQSQDFKIKMFNQITQGTIPFNYYPSTSGTAAPVNTNGLVTALGAELLNELISVYPAYTGL